ncbi:hypothetical protein M3Y99_01492900 [Aphelenchoides fujianensis]|nr:hypothetical protein M3Y99_01492900 [Aphelenchoides fujianensis]
MPQSSLESRLKNRLMYMENASARLTSLKSELRKNADLARRDIATAAGHQICCIRAREQQLLGQLGTMVDAKEQKLSKQQENLSKAIGACQRSLELLQTRNDVHQANDILMKYNAVPMRPRENPHVVFECDPTECRRAISRLGAVLVDEKVKTYDSLPSDGEQAEDAALAQKSVTQLHWRPAALKRNTTEVTMLEETDEARDSINDDDFELVHDGGTFSASDSSRESSFSSSSAVEPMETPDEPTHYILKVLNSSNSDWLRKPPVAKAEEEAGDTTPTFNHGRKMAEFLTHSTPAFEPTEPKKPRYGFEKVIDDIRASSNRRWLAAYQPANREAVENVADALGSCLNVRQSPPPAAASAPTVLHHAG